MKKLTIEQRDEIKQAWFEKTSGIPEWFYRWLNANTEKKPIQARSKSEFRRLKIQGADVLEPKQEGNWKPMDIEKDIDRLIEETGSMEELFGEEFRKCPECGHDLEFDSTNLWHCTNPNCGKVEKE